MCVVLSTGEIMFRRIGVSNYFFEDDDSLTFNELITMVFVEQPLALPGSGNYTTLFYTALHYITHMLHFKHNTTLNNTTVKCNRSKQKYTKQYYTTHSRSHFTAHSR